MDGNALYGRVEGTYFAVYLTGSYEVRQQDGYRLVICRGRRMGVVVEAQAIYAAQRCLIINLKQFAKEASTNKPHCDLLGECRIDYVGRINKERLSLRLVKR